MCQWPQSIFNPDFEKLAVIKYSELSLWYLLISPYIKYLLVFIVFPRSLFIKNLLNWFEFKTFHIFIISSVKNKSPQYFLSSMNKTIQFFNFDK